MDCVQTFVTLAVLLTLDGALEYEKPECAHDNVTFCNLLTSIHKHNEKMAQCGRPAGAPHSINICPICRRGSAPSVLKPNSTLPDGILLKIYVVRRTIVTLVALLRTRLLSLVFQLDLVQSIRAASLRSTSRLLVANPVAGYLLSTKSPPNSVRVVTSPNHGRSINGRLPKAFVDALDEIRQEMVQLRKECKELRQENRALREDNLRQRTISKATTMTSMQLFLAPLVALMLDGILAHETPECVLQGSATFCKLLFPLYKDTEQLETTLVGVTLPNLSAAVSDAKQGVLEALRAMIGPRNYSTFRPELPEQFTIKDGALTYPRLECVHKKNTLCEHLISAHIYNVELEISLGKGKNLHLSSRISMVNLRLLSIAAYMLFVADAAPAQRSPLCDNRRANGAMWYFCGHVDGAYGANLNVLHSLNKEPFRGTKKGAEYRKEVLMANQKVSEVLQKTTEEELLTAAKEVLTAEVDVLSKVKIFCEEKENSEGRCSDVLDDLSYTVEQMVLAVMELPKVKASSLGRTIETAHTEFNEEYFGGEDTHLSIYYGWSVNATVGYFQKNSYISIQMVSAGMFVTTAYALLISVGVLSTEDLHCAYEKLSEDFCEYVQDAYQVNVDVMNKLKPKDLFDEDRKRLSEANQSILELLKKAALNDLLTAFEEALIAELQAILKLGAYCSGESHWEAEKACKVVKEELGETIEELIHAITELEIAQNSTLARVANDAYMQFEGFYLGTQSNSYLNVAVLAGTEVLNAINQQKKAEKYHAN
ncbi:hypothetical protein Q1695_004369 [Nippostrongylus brasiliensis]|nr:hypothetical protein Q1695_004369 [Nippostrongylus brasiliensis]